MKILSLADRVTVETGIEPVTVTDMPVEPAMRAEGVERFFIVNVGPLSLDMENPQDAWEQCCSIADNIIGWFLNQPLLVSARLGLGVFVGEGGSSGRALAGWANLWQMDRSIAPRHGIRDVYSNVRSLRAVHAAQQPSR